MSYVPHTESDVADMLGAIGVRSVDELYAAVPRDLILCGPLDLPDALDEMSLVRHMSDLASRNGQAASGKCFLGAGIYDHFVPSVVDALASRAEFATSYTPYQPEVSQGMLQAIYEYQTMVCQLTGMELANASMYDAATGLAEAALMAADITGRSKVVVSRAVHPHYRAVLATYLHAAGYHLVEVPCHDGMTDAEHLTAALSDHTAAVVVQHPNFLGQLEDLDHVIGRARDTGALSVVSVDPISLGALRPPGDYGADVVVGEGQPLGIPMGFGGPLLGFFACRKEHLRRFPGRIVGATHDINGRRGYTMTLRTREQDIRRERATSNICTNEALLALAATVYLAEVGRTGLRRIAELCARNAHYAYESLMARTACTPVFGGRFFKEFAVRLPHGLTATEVDRQLIDRGIVGGYDLGGSYPEHRGCLLVCVTETKSRSDIDSFVEAMGSIVGDA